MKKFLSHLSRGLIVVAIVLIVVVTGITVYVVSFRQYAASAVSGHTSATEQLSKSSQPSRTRHTVQSLHSSVVMIESTWDGSVSVPTKMGKLDVPVSYSLGCTAWFVQAGLHPVLVTSSHCVNDPTIENDLLQQVYGKLPYSPTESSTQWSLSGENTQPESSDIKIVPTYDSIKTSGKRGTSLTLVDSQQTTTGDLALLTADFALPGIRPLSVAPSEPTVGSSIRSIGYPGGVTESSTAGYLEATFNPGEVSAHQISKYGFPVIEVSSALGHGMSGGPTVDANGNVIGVNMLITDQQSINFITDTTMLKQFLHKNSIGWGTPSTTSLIVK